MKRVLPPIGCLREFVRCYVVIDGTVATESPIVATSEVMLGFHLGDRPRLYDHRSRDIIDVPMAFVSGPQTERWVDLLPMTHLAGVYVRFEPGGFHRLFGVDVVAVSDHAYAGADVIGPEIATLHDAILAAPTLRARVRIVEGFLLTRAVAAQREGAVHRAARQLRACHGQWELGRLADASGVTDRQFRRQFLRQHGMSPKHYAKVLRFCYALRLKDQCPWLSWTAISQEAGYFDQTHLVKDCKALGAASPTHLMDIAADHIHPIHDERFTIPESIAVLPSRPR